MSKLILVFVMFQLSTALWAKDYILEIHNQTQKALYYIYVSHVQDHIWEEDLLDENEYLERDGQLTLTLSDYPTPYFDIRAIDSEGNFYYRYRVDAEQGPVYFKAQDRVTSTLTPKNIPNLK